MKYALSAEVRAQDRAALVSAGLANPNSRHHGWRTLQSRWPALQQDLGAFGGSSRVIAALGAFCDRGRAAEIKTFFAAHQSRALSARFNRHSKIGGCADLAAAQRPKVSDWLAS